MPSLPLKAAAAAALAVIVLSLPAAPSAAGEEKPKAAVSKANISDQRLRDFVAAAKDVFAIRQKYAPQFHAAKDDTEKRRIVQTAQGEMKQAIQKHGLTVGQYNEVLVAAKDDQALADRIGKMMGGGKRDKDG